MRAINKLRETQNLLMDGAKSVEPTRGLRTPGQAAGGGRKEDSAISMTTHDSGYGTQLESDDVVMGGTSGSSAVPASLQPGNIGNRIIETSKGLWSGPTRR